MKSKIRFSHILLIILAFAAVFSVLTFIFLRSDNSGKSTENPYSDGTCGNFAYEIARISGIGCDTLFQSGKILPDDILSNEKACCLIHESVMRSPELKKVFVPIETFTESGTRSHYYQTLFGGAEILNPDSFDGKYLAKQMQNAALFTVKSSVYSDGRLETEFCYGEMSESAFYLFEDKNDVNPAFKESVIFAVDAGFAPVFRSPENFGFLLKPKEKITETDTEKILNILRGKIPPDKFGTFSLKNTGKEFSSESYAEYFEEKYDFKCAMPSNVTLRLYNIPMLYASGRLLSSMAEGDIFGISPDADGTGYALRFVTEKFGSFCLPLSYCEGSPAVFIFSPSDLLSPEKKAEQLSLILPEQAADDFISFCAANASIAGACSICGISFQFFTREEGSVLYIGTVYEENN